MTEESTLKGTIRTLSKIVLFSIMMILAQAFGFSCSAFAHRPHDVVIAMRLAPYCLNGAVGCIMALYIIVRHNLFRSCDKAKSWQRLVRGLDNFFPLSDLAAGINSSDVVLLVSSWGDGIYRSVDGGSSWKKANNGLSSLDIVKVSFVPNSNQKAFSLSRIGDLCKTVDGGMSWQKISEVATITAITFHPKFTDNILVSDSSGAVFFSDDLGESWREIVSLDDTTIESLAFDLKGERGEAFFVGTKTKGLLRVASGSVIPCRDAGLSDSRIKKISIVPGKGQYKIFVLGANEGLFISGDGGKTWSKKVKGLTRDPQAEESKYNASHFMDMEISSDFLKNNKILVGGFDGLFCSSNGGNTWREPPSLPERALVGLSIVSQEDNLYIAAINYMGSASLSEDGGSTWKNIAWDFKQLVYGEYKIGMHRFFVRQPRFYDICLSTDFKNDHIMFVSLIYGVFVSKDKGVRWVPVLQPSGKENLVRCTVLAVSPSFKNDKTVFALTQRGRVYKSKDEGISFEEVSCIGQQKGNGSPSLVVSPDYTNDETLFATGPEGVYKTDNAGKDWVRVSDEKIASFNDYRLAIAPDYNQSSTLLVGTNHGLFLTYDGGGSWRQCSLCGDTDVWIKGIAFSPRYADDRTFLVSVKGRGLFKTVDNGKSFKKIGDDSLLFGRLSGLESASMPIAFSPWYENDNSIYAFGSPESEYYQSTDGGERWSAVQVPYNHFRMRGAIVLLVRSAKFLLNFLKRTLK